MYHDFDNMIIQVRICYFNLLNCYSKVIEIDIGSTLARKIMSLIPDLRYPLTGPTTTLLPQIGVTF